MRKRKILALVFAAVICVLSACGKGETEGTEKTENQEDTGSYLYVPETIDVPWEDDMSLENIKPTDSYLYYMLTTGLTTEICRIPLEEELDFKAGETLFQVDMHLVDYTVDQEHNLYVCTAAYDDNEILFSKRSEDGTEIYQLTLTEEQFPTSRRVNSSNIATNGSGTVYVLSTQSILQINPEGKLTGKYSLEENTSNYSMSRFLLEDSAGHVFLYESVALDIKMFEITGTGSLQLNEVPVVADYRNNSFYHGNNGILISNSDGCLYQYKKETDTLEKILRWEDSDIYDSAIQMIVQLADGRLLISISEDSGYDSYSSELLFLTKTPAEDLPEKEHIILASLFPSDKLKKSVVLFNRQSDRYHVSLDTYDASYENLEGARTRLDSSLTTSDAPDLLDLADLDIYKYIKTVDDLSPYLEKSNNIQKEDYLPNLLEGYTLNGKLVCIPRFFILYNTVYSNSDILADKDWTMESIMALTEEYPDVSLLEDMYNNSRFFMNNFCSKYYLQKFIDWENGSCDFNNEEFINLLEWINGQIHRNVAAEEALLILANTGSYVDYYKNKALLGEGTTLQGLPSADGEGYYMVNATDSIGIVTNGNNKDGAWAFLEFYLLESPSSVKTLSWNWGFPTRLQQIADVEEFLTTPSYWKNPDGTLFLNSNGEPVMDVKSSFSTNGGPWIDLYVMEQNDVDTVHALLESLDFTPRSELEKSVISIVLEESEAYFTGSKAAADAANIIQNRVQLILSEQR